MRVDGAEWARLFLHDHRSSVKEQILHLTLVKRAQLLSVKPLWFRIGALGFGATVSVFSGFRGQGFGGRATEESERGI